MYSIAILGAENSHCGHFASALAPLDGNKRFPDLELVGICGDAASCEAVSKVCTCSTYTDDYTAFVGKVDCVMITARHGGVHLSYARPYIEAGCKIWMDKPITASVEEAWELVRLVKEHKVLLCGGSSLSGAQGTRRMADFVREHKKDITGGHVTAPVSLVNEYGNFWFYSQHLVQMVTEVFGQGIVSVEARQVKDGVHAIYHYADYDVTAYFGAGYSITVYAGNYGAESCTIGLPGDYFMPELEEMHTMVTENRVSRTPEEVIYPVLIIDATIRAMEFGESTSIPVRLPS